MIRHINEIKFEGKDRWTIQFNLCSDLFMRSQDNSLSEDQREKAFKMWMEERIKLETDNY